MTDGKGHPASKAAWMKILRSLAESAGSLVVSRDQAQPDDVSDDEFFTNLAYLASHGLVESRCCRSGDGKWSWGGAEITHRGVDYIKEDGGLTAELGVVTIKLDSDSIKALM